MVIPNRAVGPGYYISRLRRFQTLFHRHVSQYVIAFPKE